MFGEPRVSPCFAPEEREASLPIRVVAVGVPVDPVNATYFPKAPSSEGDGRSSMRPRAQVEPGGTGESEAVGEGGEGARAVPTEGGSAQPSIAAPQGDLSPAGEPAAGGASSSGSVHEGLAAKLRDALASGSWLAFLLVFVAGFLTSFTPCVYPMIPITIGYIAGASRGRLSGFILSLFFVLGIAIVYSTLGRRCRPQRRDLRRRAPEQGRARRDRVGLPPDGRLDARRLRPEPSLRPADARCRSGRRGGWAGAVMMGGITGLVASPCVGPVLVVLLTWVAQVGRPLYGFGLLFTFALGLGVLFLVIGTLRRRDEGPAAGRGLDGDGEALLRLDLPRARRLLSAHRDRSRSGRRSSTGRC